MHTHRFSAPRAFCAPVIALAVSLLASLGAAPLKAQDTEQEQGLSQSPTGEPGTMHLLQMSVERGSGAVDEFRARTPEIRSCEEARLLGVELSAKMVENRSVRPVQLPERLQAVMSKMATGQATPPFGAGDGPIRVLVICNRF
ncbi:MAG: hypothetical protein AAFZ11_09425 [Pseudomonadota bacterium]